ncbi:MAG: hypothetical protein WCY05_05755, partial [Candidatus Omnitrophota bacterium]
DQWCDYNEVYYNICHANDGAGINIFDGANNNIYNNTLWGNMLNPGKSHAYRAELVLATDYVHNVNRVDNINIMNNIIVANDKNNYAIYVGDLTAKNNLRINNNLLFNTQESDFYYFGGKRGKDVNIFDTAQSAKSMNFSKNPEFIKNPPLRLSDFMVARSSICIGKGIFWGQVRDILGKKIDEKSLISLGAIESGDNN